MIDQDLEFAQTIAYSTKETLRFTYQMAAISAMNDGVFVECGVAAGAQVIAMHKAAPTKKIFAFDSFEGIPLPSNRDDQMPGIRYLTEDERKALPDPGKQELKSTGATAVSLADFNANLITAGVDLRYIKAVPGWFEKTVPAHVNRIKVISLLRLDGDLYNSTYVCLKHLFPRVEDGGTVIIDDWQLPGCQAACKDYFAKVKYNAEYNFISNIAYLFK